MKKIIRVLLALAMFTSLVTGSLAKDAADELSTDGWTFDASSVNQNKGIPQEVPQNVTDGNLDTHWHSMIEPKAEAPHYFTVILPGVTEVGGYRYYPRASSSGSAKAGTVTKYEIYVSADGKNYEKAAAGMWEETTAAKTAKFPKNYRAKYVRLQILEATGGYASAGEIRLLKPDKSKQTVNVTGKIQLSGAKAPSGTSDEKTGTDDELSTDGWTFDSSSVNQNKGIPQEVPQNVTDGNLDTHWHSMIEPKAEAPHYFTVILPGVTEVGGYRYYPRASSSGSTKAGTVTKYEIYVSADGKNYEKAAAGMWEETTAAKTAKFPKNYRAKYVRLQILEATGGYASAGEIRLLKPEKSKQTVNVTGTIQFPGAKVQTAANEKEKYGDELPTKGWTFDASSINETKGVPTEMPENVTDGDLDTHWHSMIEPKAELPHYLTVILPEETYVSGYRYYPRASASGNAKAGTCTKYEIYVSADGKDFVLATSGSWPADTKAKTADFKMNIKAKAVKLVMTEAVLGYGSAGEIRLLSAKDGYKDLTVSEFKNSYDDVHLRPVLFEGMKVSVTGNSAHDVSAMADGVSSTYWHTEMVAGKLPQEISYNLRFPYTIEGLRYVPRQDGNLTGHFLKFAVYSSSDGVNYTEVKTFTAEASEATKDFMFDSPVKAPYIKIVLTDGLYGYGTCADLYFLQKEGTYKKELIDSEESYILHIGDKNVSVKKNGIEKTVTLDTAPFIRSGYTMIPLRGLMEEMGKEVIWNGEIQRITVYDSETEMILTVEDDRVYINDKRYNAAAAPIIKDSRTFIPLRFMSEQTGYNVYWDAEKQEIKISTR